MVGASISAFATVIEALKHAAINAKHAFPTAPSAPVLDSYRIMFAGKGQTN